ncbi:hypothetical protein HYPSUDRAFT_589153 [Hypholoma sublateritium FD-334 SS-4]|uniref:Uncharacterized protein n=1 Tax=Hypholoma sublateritium (strain FD-334 SS-4) TaxID=945553 RepID=A0A0D2P3D2_HYPSF|nr:hypothetical protein HYPSUDRAFT_589153 [Hypholoma sublateritium FD-334 SS-4]
MPRRRLANVAIRKLCLYHSPPRCCTLQSPYDVLLSGYRRLLFWIPSHFWLALQVHRVSISHRSILMSFQKCQANTLSI